MVWTAGTTKVSIAGICSLVLTVGFARFAYTPLLPIMTSQTWLTEVSAGWLATWNYLGYMSGALIATSIRSLKIKFQLFRIGLVIGVLSTFGMGLTQDMVLWVALRYVSGLSSTTGLLISSGLVLNWLITNGKKPELGIHFSGMGLGIVAAGVIVLVTSGLTNWTGQWFTFGALSLVLLLPAWAWLPAPVSVPAGDLVDSNRQSPSVRWMRMLSAAYFCAGFGYAISATFIVVIVEKVPTLSGKGSLVWVIVGLAATPACFVWDRIARQYGVVFSLLVAFGLQIMSFLLSILSESSAAAYLSAGLFGATFMGIVNLTLTLIGRRFPANPAKAMARLTLSYGAAQIIAPALAGYIAHYTGGFNGALILAAAVMAIGMMFLAAFQKQESEDLKAIFAGA